MVIASELREGTVVRIEGQLYRVLETEFKAGAAKLSGVVKTKLRAIASGRLWEVRLRPEERVEDLETQQQAAEFLFADAQTCTLMNADTFEQFEVPRGMMGAAERFLQPGAQVRVEFFEAQPLSVALPETIEARVAETAPPSRSHQDSTWKDARLDNGAHVRVPLFIAPGELIRVNVETLHYVERAHPERKRSA